MWALSRSSPSGSSGESSPITQQATAMCQQTIWPAPTRDAAALEDPQRAQVQPLGHGERDEDPGVERHARQCGAT